MAAQVSLDGTAGVEVVLESTAVSLAALTVIGSREELDETRREIGAYQKYVLRVPNERAFATTRVHLTFRPACG